MRNVFLITCLAILGACSAILRNPAAADLHLDTSVLGRTDLRYWGDEIFDLAYMSELFEFGYQRALDGDAFVEVDINRLVPARTE